MKTQLIKFRYLFLLLMLGGFIYFFGKMPKAEMQTAPKNPTTMNTTQ